jgi:NosR/NirI family nitrous oxide reductase transcriptional regulator
MKRISILSAVVSGLLLLAGLSLASVSTYEAPLPARLSTDPHLCAYAPCKDVIDADAFSPRKGRPRYVEAYKTKAADGNEGRVLVGYVFLSTDILDIPGYSGKPLVTLMGMDAKGVITGVKILRHGESILLVGLPESELNKFIEQYVGKFVGDRIEIGASRENRIGVDAISGATVTAIAQNQVILRSAYEVAKQVGIIKTKPRPAAKFTPIDERLPWSALLKQGLVQRLKVEPRDVGTARVGGEPYIDMYFGYLNVPTVGKSILGEHGYRRLMADLNPTEHALFIIASGSGTFKGSGFVRGGIYERIQVVQDLETFTFRDTDYFNLYSIEAPGAPVYRESGVFVIRGGNFSPAYPWSLVFLANKVDRETGAKTFVNFEREYWLPDRYLEGGRPERT